MTTALLVVIVVLLLDVCRCLRMLARNQVAQAKLTVRGQR